MTGTDGEMPRTAFRAMADSTAQDWATIYADFQRFAGGLADRILAHLRLLDGDFGGFPIDRLQHSLQTATRAYRDGQSDSYVVMALLHDLGDTLGTYNHPDVAAAIVQPFVSEEEHWICANHGVFQGYYFFHYLGGDRDAREQLRGHPHFESCARFCERYDQAAFDAGYETLPLAFFEPILRQVVARPHIGLYVRES